MPDLVFIRKQKRPDGSGFWGAYETGEDAFGVWLFTPRGSSYRGEKGGSTAYCNVGSPEGPGIPVMHLVPRAAWWIATFWAPAEVPRSLTFDISTAPHLEGAVRSYVDLELDVWVEALTGSVQLEDEDEFVAACTNGTISPPEAKAATLAADDIATLVRRRKRDLLLDPSAQGPHARRGRLTRPARGQHHRLRSRLPGDGQALRVEVHAR